MEEIVMGIVQATEIRGVTKDGHLDYGATNYQGGGEDGDTRFQCRKCGEAITDGYGRSLSLVDIAEFLQE